MVIINTLGLITKEIYYLEHKIEKLTLMYMWGIRVFCRTKQDSLVRVMP